MSPRRDSSELLALGRGGPGAPEISLPAGTLGELLAAAAADEPRALLGAATRAITDLLGERGACILLEGGPRVVLPLGDESFAEQPIDLAEHPEVSAAVARRRLVASDEPRGGEAPDGVLALAPADLGVAYAVPLVARERCLGVVRVRGARGRRVAASVREAASLLGRLAAHLLAPLVRGAEPEPEPPARPPGPAASAPETPPLAGGRVLVVEDDAGLADALSDALCQAGYRVDCAKDGADGLRRAALAPPDVVLLDVNLPGMSGFDAAASLRRATPTGGVPIVFFSGAEDLPARVRDVGLEQVDFMPKPFTLDELLARVQQALGQSRTRQRLQLAAEQDELTGLGNLRLLRRRLESERARFSRYGDPLSVAMIDVDKLKAVNDTYGHLAGNEALRGVAGVLARQARDTDLVVRYGGDEFVALLPHTALGDACRFGQRVLSEIEALSRGGFGVTVSIGVAALTRRGSVESGDELLSRADRAAYRSKQAGGNRVSTADDEPQVTER